MELVAGLDTQIFVIFLGVVVALGCTLVAFLVDYLKGKNERLREQVLEMTVRQEERARHPQVQLDSNAVLSAIAQVGKNLENVVRAAVHSENVYEMPPVSEPVFQARPSATAPAPVTAVDVPVSPPATTVPAAEVPTPETSVPETTAPVAQPLVGHTLVGQSLQPAPVVDPLAAAIQSEPDWRSASWHEETQKHQPVVIEETLAATPTLDAAAEAAVPAEAEFSTVATKPIRETLRSLFDTPSSIAKASQLEMERRLDESIPEVAEPVAEHIEAPAAAVESEEPVVRIRVLNNNVATPLEEAPVAEATAVEAESVAAEEPIVEALPAISEELTSVAEEIYLTEETAPIEELPVTAPVDFLTAADLGEAVPPAPHESFDSLMAAVNGESAAAVEPETVEPETVADAPEVHAEEEGPGVLALPSGMNDRATLDFLKRDKALFTGLIVSIGINDYARLQDASGRPAAEDLAKSVSQLVKSLITASNGSEAFGCRSADDEFVLVFANENGSVAQRRLNALSERLWDFQLRSLGNFSVMFSWGATEANGETFADAVEAASERMRETRHNRRTISMEKTRLKKVG